MDHIAIMRKSWKLIPKILSGEKTIETRWYKIKRDPWGTIGIGDTVFFKNSGEPIIAKAVVENVRQFDKLDEVKIFKVRRRYKKEIGITEKKLSSFGDFFKGKKYGILIFLKKPEDVAPFEINKKGFGIGTAWISVHDVNQIKKN